MRAAERGALLLCCALGDPSVRPLTTPQFRELSKRAAAIGIGRGDPERDLLPKDLLHLGYSQREADRIATLLDRESQLELYLEKGRRLGIHPLTRLSRGYPVPLVEKLRHSCPPVLFFAGNLSLLNGPFVGLAGSRRLSEGGAAFARRVGELAAKEGLVLVTGGAEGSDSEAEDACIRAGGTTVTFVPDNLSRRVAAAGEGRLLISESGWDLPFSTHRALSRNRYVHMMGEKTVIAETGCGSGGTWNGSLENLKHGWSQLYVHDDGSPGAKALAERGGIPVKKPESLRLLQPAQDSLY